MKETTKRLSKSIASDQDDKISPEAKTMKSKKILAVFDGFKFSKSTLDYAIQVTKEANGFLVGIFLDDTLYRSYSLLKVLKTDKNAEKLMAELDARDQEKRDVAVKQFETACGRAGVHYTYHRNTGIAIHELKQESIFADLMVINDNETFNRFSENPPTRFIRELLADVQCPVLIVPEKFKRIDKITLLYDGGPSSVYAIKMFSYLFGHVNDTPVDVLTVKDPVGGTHLPNNKLMREFIKRHFPKAKFIVEKGDAEKQVIGHLRYQKGNELVVLGAYRRSEISRWFKASMADILMKELNTPLFIAHNK